MDTQILTELYHSIYENQEVLDEGIKDFFFGKPDSEGYVNTPEEAEVVLNVMSESKIQEIISELN
jgi:hypothetical protein